MAMDIQLTHTGVMGGGTLVPWCPAQSTDLNSTGHLWDELQHQRASQVFSSNISTGPHKMSSNPHRHPLKSCENLVKSLLREDFGCFNYKEGRFHINGHGCGTMCPKKLHIRCGGQGSTDFSPYFSPSSQKVNALNSLLGTSSGIIDHDNQLPIF